jgi:hypothetical protein
MIIPLNLIESNGFLFSDSILLFKNLDGICFVGQVWFQWDGIFHYYINQRLQTSFELGDMEYIVYTC